MPVPVLLLPRLLDWQLLLEVLEWLVVAKQAMSWQFHQVVELLGSPVLQLLVLELVLVLVLPLVLGQEPGLVQLVLVLELGQAVLEQVLQLLGRPSVPTGEQVSAFVVGLLEPVL